MPQSTASRKCKDNPWSGRKYLQSIYLIEGSYLKCMKSSYKLNSKKTSDVIEKWAKDLKKKICFSKIGKNGQLSTLKC